jgi:hypothetical protein
MGTQIPSYIPLVPGNLSKYDVAQFRGCAALPHGTHVGKRKGELNQWGRMVIEYPIISFIFQMLALINTEGI